MTREPPLWRVVATRGMRDLWTGGRATWAMTILALGLSAVSILLARSASINLLDAREGINTIAQITVTVGAVLSMLVAADAISGERERDTLESILLAPLSRRDIVVGKSLSSASLLLVSLVIGIPYLVVAGYGTEKSISAAIATLVVGIIIGTILTLIGTLISIFSSNNRVSFGASLLALVILALPSQLPPVAKQGLVGRVTDVIDPISASLKFMTSVIVDEHPWTSEAHLLIVPFLLVILGSWAVISAGRNIRLEGGVHR